MQRLTPVYAHGRLSQRFATAREAAEASDLAHDVVATPLYFEHGTDVREVPGRVAIRRADTGDVVGIVSDRYQIIQYRDAFGALDSLAQAGKIEYSAALMLGRGMTSKATMLATIVGAEQEIAEGDVVSAGLQATTSHDGSSASNVGTFVERFVCSNGMTVRYKGASTSIRHTGNAAERMRRVADQLAGALDGFHAYVDQARELARVRLTDNQFEAYLTAIYGEGPHSGRRRNELDAIRRAYHADPRQQIASIRGTAWAALNAVTQYHDHDRWRRSRADASRRATSALVGSGATAKQGAYQTALDMFA